MIRKRYPAWILAGSVLLTGCNSDDSSDDTAANTPAQRCESLKDQALDETQLTSSTLETTGDDGMQACHVAGKINERTSPVDGQTYAIGFELWLPVDWNGRFYYQGGGGTDGAIQSVDPALLAEGWAVVVSDSGHSNDTNVSELAGTNEFGLDPQARLDYGYNGPAQATLKAKALTESFYDDAIDYSYFQGCSEGGREGLMFSQRYPTYFDGIVAGNPGMDLPKAAVAEAWDSQAFAEAATQTTEFGNPDLASAFSNDDLSTIGNAILDACDADDGLVDGMVFDPQACDFDPSTLGPGGTGDLTAAQVTALQKVFGGAKNALDEPLYAGWFWDPGIAAQGWRMWKTGPLSPDIPGNSGLNVTLGGGSLPFVFTTPPNSMTNGTAITTGSQVEDANPLDQPGMSGYGGAFVQWILGFNMDTDAPKIYATDDTYTEAAMTFMGTSSTDYAGFRDHGSKLLMYTGQADPVFSSKYHLQWYNNLVSANGGLAATQNFARIFVVPGMNHCGGGPSTSQFDSLSALQQWVEKDQAPERITATAPESTPWPGRTRPLCAYPQQAHYTGSGDIEDASNFECRTP
ncbi:tannase/feruloyl esterase family alpha/beta hydrolase [Marinobacter sp. NFXS9]|uniref:tannase/feruloyl esterase family alpha/beta hydrolase n=1 Tax=Marinobacter sp. NFXS9 TaxID=2818433 RepID=UPI0032DF9A67